MTPTSTFRGEEVHRDISVSSCDLETPDKAKDEKGEPGQSQRLEGLSNSTAHAVAGKTHLQLWVVGHFAKYIR